LYLIEAKRIQSHHAENQRWSENEFFHGIGEVAARFKSSKSKRKFEKMLDLRFRVLQVFSLLSENCKKKQERILRSLFEKKSYFFPVF
jgi:hypothetical protein